LMAGQGAPSGHVVFGRTTPAYQVAPKLRVTA
jgi:hypothetical protein